MIFERGASFPRSPKRHTGALLPHCNFDASRLAAIWDQLGLLTSARISSSIASPTDWTGRSSAGTLPARSAPGVWYGPRRDQHREAWPHSELSEARLSCLRSVVQLNAYRKRSAIRWKDIERYLIVGAETGFRANVADTKIALHCGTQLQWLPPACYCDVAVIN